MRPTTISRVGFRDQGSVGAYTYISHWDIAADSRDLNVTETTDAMSAGIGVKSGAEGRFVIPVRDTSITSTYNSILIAPSGTYPGTAPSAGAPWENFGRIENAGTPAFNYAGNLTDMGRRPVYGGLLFDFAVNVIQGDTHYNDLAAFNKLTKDVAFERTDGTYKVYKSVRLFVTIGLSLEPGRVVTTRLRMAAPIWTLSDVVVFTNANLTTLEGKQRDGTLQQFIFEFIDASTIVMSNVGIRLQPVELLGEPRFEGYNVEGAVYSIDETDFLTFSPILP